MNNKSVMVVHVAASDVLHMASLVGKWMKFKKSPITFFWVKGVKNRLKMSQRCSTQSAIIIVGFVKRNIPKQRSVFDASPRRRKTSEPSKNYSELVADHMKMFAQLQHSSVNAPHKSYIAILMYKWELVNRPSPLQTPWQEPGDTA